VNALGPLHRKNVIFSEGKKGFEITFMVLKPKYIQVVCRVRTYVATFTWAGADPEPRGPEDPAGVPAEGGGANQRHRQNPRLLLREERASVPEP
jgi:hypothetical protein